MLFEKVFDDWQARAGVLSALPDAPVVPDRPPRERPTWRRWRPAPRLRTVAPCPPPARPAKPAAC